MKIFNGIIAVLFLLFAVVQFNDPDPWGWVLLYGFVAGVAGFAVFRKYNRWTILLGLGVCLVWLGFLVPEFINWVNMGMPTITGSMKAEEPHVEFTREFLGLFLCILALVFYFFQEKRYRNSVESSSI